MPPGSSINREIGTQEFLIKVWGAVGNIIFLSAWRQWTSTLVMPVRVEDLGESPLLVSLLSVGGRCCQGITPQVWRFSKWLGSETSFSHPLQSGADRAECHQHLPGVHRGGLGGPLEDQTDLEAGTAVLVQPVDRVPQIPVSIPEARAGSEYQAHPGQVWGNPAQVSAS